MAATDTMRLTSFTIAPGARWDVDVLSARFPSTWLTEISRAYYSRPEIRPDHSLPSRGLIELLIGLDPAVHHVNNKLTADHFIIAADGVDPAVLTEGIAAWAYTAVSDTINWWSLLDPNDLTFEPATFNLLEYTRHQNGTAAPSPQMFNLLPRFLAQDVVASKLELLERERDWILGPPRRNGRRDAVLWPPRKIRDDKAGEGFATAKITFHVETVPNHPVPHVHADLTTSRFPVTPVTYVPARGDGPPGATLWLYAPEGFLRQHEPHTLLAAPVQQRYATGGAKKWQWMPGLATALARLTHLPFPAPEKVFANPANAADEGKIRAYLLYSEGTKSQANDDDPEPDEADSKKLKAKSVLHVANTGFVPADHLEAHGRLTELLERRGMVPIEDLPRVGKRLSRLVKPTEVSGATYTLEVWTQNDLTRQAILAALEHHHGLTPQPAPGDGSPAQFTGDITVNVLFREVGTLGAGIVRAEGDTRPEATLLGQFANQVERTLGVSPEPRAAIFELEGDKHFSIIRRVDPKPALKKAFARTDRRLQCLRPAKLFVPPAKPPSNPKKARTPYPGTNFTKDSIYRASAAISDALRQLGRLGGYETPADLPDFEHIGIWLHHDGNTVIPIVIRLRTGHDATAYLASADGTTTTPIPYRDLPTALAQGKGRIRSGPRQKNAVAQFLINTLGIGDAVSRDTHDRLVFVRSASFRNWGWDWLQDKHIVPDQLALPGQDIDDQPPQMLTPEQCPGLRIVRVRDRSSTSEIAYGFAADYETSNVRISGLFRFADRVYYSINPRSDQMQTPLGVTKLDPDVDRNLLKQAANPVPLEIHTAFLQAGDNSDAYATLVSRMRRSYLHTEQDTTYPAVLHLCELADEYL